MKFEVMFQNAYDETVSYKTLDEPSVIGAMETAVWLYGEDLWVRAVYPVGEAIHGPWRLISAQYWTEQPPERYDTIDDAMNASDQNGEILIAIPDQ